MSEKLFPLYSICAPASLNSFNTSTLSCPLLLLFSNRLFLKSKLVIHVLPFCTRFLNGYISFILLFDNSNICKFVKFDNGVIFDILLSPKYNDSNVVNPLNSLISGMSFDLIFYAFTTFNLLAPSNIPLFLSPAKIIVSNFVKSSNAPNPPVCGL